MLLSQTPALTDQRRPAEVSLSLLPDSGVQRLEAKDSWRAASSPVRFYLEPDNGGFPHGWVLLTGRLSHTILDGSARLVVSCAQGERFIDVPVSVGGRVYELIKLPPGIKQMAWEPSQSSGIFEHTAMIARNVGPAERLWLMTRRIAFMLWTQPRQIKSSVGLSWWKPFFDLPGQYRACGRLRSYLHELPYRDWIQRFDRLTDDDRKRIRRRIAKLRDAPHFAIVLGDPGGNMERTLSSIECQLYRNYSVVGPGAQFQPTDYVCVLQAGDQLAEHALYWMAESILAGGNVAMAYADQDVLDANGARTQPQFKPDWSPEHLRSINYVGRWAVFRAAEFAAAGGLSPESLSGDGHELNTRVAAALNGAKVAHVPAVLYHRAAATPEVSTAPRTRHPVPGTPLVSIVIPTRDAAALLRNCIDSIERRSAYQNYEILIVDNQSSAPEALHYLAGLAHRVLRYDHKFNYSAINNLAVRAARGEVVVLLNNDTEVISADWLEEMLGHLHQKGVGVVGPKLLYAHGAVQQAGTAVGPGGCADHLHVGIDRDAAGYCHRAAVAQELSSVTGACLMTWKSLYERLGGLDERSFPVTFNDVDYCLRVQEAGYRVIFTPHAQLYHHESASRGQDISTDQQARAAREVRSMRHKWQRRMEHDPYYNPNLSYRRPDFSLSDAPRVRKPWLRS